MMKTKKRTKIIACSMAVIFLNSMLFPTVSYALTGGPSQAEFHGFEPVGTTDVVNLNTGDFTYGIPAISIPGPGGGFSMPISYHSGIKLEQEASWVGLGWSLNPGVINRTVSQFPDDVLGGIIDNQITNSGGYGYSINAFNLYEYNKDSESGSGGRVGLFDLFKVGWGNKSGLTALGVTFNAGQVDVDPMGVYSSVSTIASMGANGVFSSLSSVGSSLGRSVVQSVFTGAITGAIKGSTYSLSNINNWTIKSKNNFIHSTYEYSFDHTQTVESYGSLYLGDMTNLRANTSYKKLDVNGNVSYADFFRKQDGTVIASDMHMFKHASDEYEYTINPTSIAYDQYIVNGAGISGAIKPFRHEVGSLSYVADLTTNSDFASNSINLVPFEKAYYSPGVNTSKKTPFYYKDISNQYQHPAGDNDLGISLNNYLVNIKTDNEWDYDGTANNDKDYLWGTTEYQLTDDVLDTDRKEGNRNDNSLTNNKLARNKHIDWFSVEEVQNGYAANQGFIVGDLGAVNYGTYESIAGFMITNTDGTIYHYSIPVFEFDNYNYSRETADQANTSSTDMLSDYGHSWLLTAITHSDYVDRGTVGQVDEEDFGGWVKFEYAQSAGLGDYYGWRFPYTGYRSNEGGSGEGYSSGNKLKYYLESISTKTHIALFVKGLREDAKGTLDQNGTGYGQSLFLDEVILLQKEHYNLLTESTSNGGYGFTKDQGSNTSPSFYTLGTSFNADQLIDLSDLDATHFTTQLNYIREKQITAIKFNYNYSLCKNTPNSYSNDVAPPTGGIGAGGKLTLTSLETYGRNNNKLIPDYSFGYSSNNPNYHKDKWDGWGAYSSLVNNGQIHGIDMAFLHKADDNYADAWHLKSIDLPTGAVLDVEYEKDSYSSISGDSPEFELGSIRSNSVNGGSIIREENNKNVEHIFEPGQSITLGIEIKEYENIFHPAGQSLLDTRYINGTYTITSVIGNEVYISYDILANNPPITSNGDITKAKCHSNNTFKGTSFGGDVRVSQVSIKDEFNRSNTTAYRYTLNNEVDGISSGVVSKEPAYIRDSDENNLPDYYDFYDYPETGVLYSKVTVLGNYKSDNDYLSKTIYEFISPHKDMVQKTVTGSKTQYLDNDLSSEFNDFDAVFSKYYFDVQVNTASIGQLKSITSYNQHNEFQNSTTYDFAEPGEFGDLGVYKEGTILADNFVQGDGDSYQHLFRTTKTYTPIIPQAVVFKDNYSEKRVENTAYDNITGAVLETEYYDAWGAKYRTKSVPAYTVAEYADMGPKTVNSSNKNMMSQSAGQYLYSYNEDGTQDLVSASISTWNNDWDYRELSTSGSFSEIKEANYTNEVYRRHKSYAWKSELNNDGTYANFTEFDYDPVAGNSGWDKLSEVTLYDHYSRPLESEDLYGFKTSMKYDVSGNYSLIAAGNAAQSEIFFSSLELDPVNELLSDNLYYNSTDATFSSEQAHTGAQSLKLTGTQGMYANMDIIDHKDFVLSAWVHSSNWTNAKLKVEFYSGGNTTPFNSEEDAGTSIMQLKAGDWYLISLEVDLSKYSAATRLVASVENSNTSNPIYIDDFKFTPLESSSSCTVHDPETFKVVATLDADHLAKVYEYDSNGILKVVKQEVGDTPSLSGGMKTVQEYFYNYGKNN